MYRKLLISFLVVLLLLMGCGKEATPPPTLEPTPEPTPEPTAITTPADIIFYNGNVITINDEQPLAEAVAILGNKIIAVGDNDSILAYQDSMTKVIDLAGQTLMPGFIEGHSHALHFAPGGEIDKDGAIQIALSYGLTTLNEMVVNEEDIAWLMEAEESGRLRLRVNAFPLYNDLGLDSTGKTIIKQVWFPENGPILDPERYLRVPGIKVYVDGSFILGRGCPALSEPYPEEFRATPDFQRICFEDNGDLYLTQEELNFVVSEAQASGFRVAFHIMGDLGIDVALNAIENALDGESNLIYRHAIQHNSLLRPDQVDRYVELGILASVRGYFNTCDQDDYEYYFGTDRYTWVANRYILIDRGVHAFSEGDYLWRFGPEDLTNSTQLNPMVNLFGLVTRKQQCKDGSLEDPKEWLFPDAINVEEALHMLTIEPAYTVSQEDHLGSIEPGKFADLIILSDDPFTVDPDDLLYLKVWMTMVGGKMEYCIPGHEDLCP